MCDGWMDREKHCRIICPCMEEEEEMGETSYISTSPGQLKMSRQTLNGNPESI